VSPRIGSCFRGMECGDGWGGCAGTDNARARGLFSSDLNGSRRTEPALLGPPRDFVPRVSGGSPKQFCCRLSCGLASVVWSIFVPQKTPFLSSTMLSSSDP